MRVDIRAVAADPLTLRGATNRSPGARERPVARVRARLMRSFSPSRPPRDSIPAGPCQGPDNIRKFVNCRDSRPEVVRGLTESRGGCVVLSFEQLGCPAVGGVRGVPKALDDPCQDRRPERAALAQWPPSAARRAISTSHRSDRARGVTCKPGRACLPQNSGVTFPMRPRWPVMF